LKKANTLRISGAVVALAAVSALGAGGPASANSEPRQRGIEAVIDIKGGGNNLRFQGDDQVVEGDQLEINNLTDPNEVGPHTFSLVTRQARPSNGRERRKCEDIELKVCERIVEAHNIEFGPNPPPITYSVENGNPGWDLPFDRDTDGDSWFTETEGDTTSREVSNLTDPFVGKLRYFCAVHPFMKGKITVIQD
jgi:hypothetical protein